MAIQQPASLTPNGVEIQSPASNRHHAAPVGGIHVGGEAGGNVVRVHIKIERLAYVIPAAPTDGGWTITDVDSGRFGVDNVPGTVTTAIAGNNDNKVIAFPELGGGAYGTRDVAYFVGRPAQEVQQVSGQHCMWFAFAADGLQGPGDPADTEADTANHKPPSLITPVNAEAASVTAVGNWRHFNVQGQSDADGMNPVVGLEFAGYQSATYNSESIAIIATHVNKLIGMWVDAFDAPIGDPFPIGKGPAALTIPANAHRLFFAHHDGNRWHNNGGHVDVTIDWTLASNFMRRRLVQSQRQGKQYEIEGQFRVRVTEIG